MPGNCKETLLLLKCSRPSCPQLRWDCVGSGQFISSCISLVGTHAKRNSHKAVYYCAVNGSHWVRQGHRSPLVKSIATHNGRCRSSRNSNTASSIETKSLVYPRCKPLTILVQTCKMFARKKLRMSHIYFVLILVRPIGYTASKINITRLGPKKHWHIYKNRNSMFYILFV